MNRRLAFVCLCAGFTGLGTTGCGRPGIDLDSGSEAESIGNLDDASEVEASGGDGPGEVTSGGPSTGMTDAEADGSTTDSSGDTTQEATGEVSTGETGPSDESEVSTDSGDGDGDGDGDGTGETTTGDGDGDGDSPNAQIGDCEASNGSVEHVYWGPTEVDSICTEAFFDGSNGGYAWGFDCPEGGNELTFHLSPDLPANFWPNADEYSVRVRQDGEQVWLASFYPSGALFALAVEAETPTPPGEPDFFAPYSFDLVSVGCDWDNSDCIGQETAAIEIKSEFFDPVNVVANSHGNLLPDGSVQAWTGTVYIERDDTEPVDPKPCEPQELHDRIQLLVHGEQQ